MFKTGGIVALCCLAFLGGTSTLATAEEELQAPRTQEEVQAPRSGR